MVQIGVFYGNYSNYSDYGKYYLKSANFKKPELQPVEAYLSMARCFENGIGVYRELQEAFMWYSKAANKGNIAAKAALLRVEAELQKSVKEKANSLPLSITVQSAARNTASDQEIIGEMLTSKSTPKHLRESKVFTFAIAAETDSAKLKRQKFY